VIYALIIALMAALDIIMWQAIRMFESRGSVFVGLGFIQRESSPRWYRFHIIMWWTVLGLCVTFTLIMSLWFMAAGINA
jgi:hypothetical protein